MNNPKKFHYEIKNQADNAEILIYGYIGPWEAMDYKKFQNDFRQMLSISKNVTVRIHSGGGSVYEGLAIYDLMRSSDSHIKVVVEGMAASMAGPIALGGDEIEMTENAFFMMHAVQGGYFGNKRGFLAYVQQMEGCENRLAKIYKERTKVDEETINGWLDSDQDTWIDADQCLKLSICDSIIKPVKKRKFETPEDMANKSMEEMFACFEGDAPTITTENKINLNMKNQIIAILAVSGIAHALTASSDDQAFVNVLDQLSKKAKTADDLQAKMDEFVKTNAKVLIAQAQKDGKITAAEAPEWEQNAIENYDLTAKAIAKMAGKPGDINASLLRDPKNDLDTAHELLKNRSEWDFEKWQKEDPKGLAKLEGEAPDEFKKLFNAKFNK